jgi:hypothetical protein
MVPNKWRRRRLYSPDYKQEQLESKSNDDCLKRATVLSAYQPLDESGITPSPPSAAFESLAPSTLLAECFTLDASWTGLTDWERMSGCDMGVSCRETREGKCCSSEP